MSIKYDYNDKNVVVTGAAKGLGKAIATKFVEAGANVAIVDFDEESGLKTAEELGARGSKVIFHKTDISNVDSVNEMAKYVLETFGTVDILVNNAGTAPKFVGPPLPTLDSEDWQRVYNVNVVGMVNVCKAFYKNFYVKKGGKIVNIASIAGFMPTPVIPQYAASKAAAMNFTHALAQEMGNFNVNVNCVNPGYIYTDIYVHNGLKIKSVLPHLFQDCETSEEVVNKMARDSVLHRAQEPDDIAYAVLFLASDEAKNITGQSLNVDSGKILR